jgi:hypothetical protein
MEEWYRQQDFYTDIQHNKIKAWMNQETVDLFSYTAFEPSITIAG